MILGPDTGPGGLRRLLLAQAPADFADWLDFVAIGALLAFTWTADPFVFAVLAVAMGLPYLVVGPFAGSLVDRSDTRRILVWSNVGRALATAALVLAPNWPALLAGIAVRSSIDTFFTPAKQSAIQALTEPGQRNRANAVSHGINQVSKIVAPALGGALSIWLSPQCVCAINAAVSLGAAWICLGLRDFPPAIAPDGDREEGRFVSIRNGWTEMVGNLPLKAAIALMAAGYFAMFFYDTLIAPLIREFGFDQSQLGLALAAVGAGGVLGSAGMALVRAAPRPFVTVAAASFVAGVIVLGLGWAEISGASVTAWAVLLAWFGLGIASALTVIPFRTVLQDQCSDRSIGQITALSEAVNTVALLTAPFIGALVATAFSLGAAFVLGGLVMLGVAVAAALLWKVG